MNKLIRYFDLLSERRSGHTKGIAIGPQQMHWLPQYISLILGITIQPFFAEYQKTTHWHFAGISGRLLFAVIAGLIIFPGVYKNAFDPEKPLIVQLCAIFAAGMGWESLLRTALKLGAG